MFITPYGVFYEGQIVSAYSCHGDFIEYVKIKKFIVHYKNKKSPYNYRKNKVFKLFVNFQDLTYNTKNYTVSAEQLGTLYKICENLDFCIDKI